MAETKTESAPAEKQDLPWGRELTFTEPGAERRLKNIFTVKAFDPDGTLVQLPVADQINNNVASPENMLGLRIYEKKGFDVLWDHARGVGAYCPMGDCFAEWNPQFGGYCSTEHRKSMDIRDNPGRFGGEVTSTRTAYR